MGTRGFIGVAVDGDTKISYNHFDSYPSELGIDALNDVRELAKDPLHLVALARALRMVDEQDCAPSGKEWYHELRDKQGHLRELLEGGVMTDAKDFPLDSLFCEWGYLVNLDHPDGGATLEVYKGFQQTLPKNGRWAGRPTEEEDLENHVAHLTWCAENKREPWLPVVSEYKAVEMIASWPLDALPADEEMLALERTGADA